MTGRAAGFCAGNGTPGSSTPATGRGFGFGRGRGGGGGFGRGFRHLFYATGLPGWPRDGGSAVPDNRSGGFGEKQALTNQAQALQAQLDGVQARLRHL